jgi:hypothetical protein
MSRGTVTRVRQLPGGYDPYGDPIPGGIDELDIENCVWAPRMTANEGEGLLAEQGRHGVIVGKNLFPPPGADIRRTDQIRILGELYDIEGEVGQWASPYTGIPMGGQVALRRVEG